VRVPPDEFLGDRLHHVAKVEGALFFRHTGMEDDLKQKVAKLVLEISEIVPCNRVGNFIGFFQGVRRDRRKILRQIPRTAGFRCA